MKKLLATIISFILSFIFRPNKNMKMLMKYSKYIREYFNQEEEYKNVPKIKIGENEVMRQYIPKPIQSK